MVALLALCAHHAFRAGGVPRVWQLLAGVLFGVALEWATIQQLHAYEYGRFLMMIDEVPVCIGFGWGVIIYSVRLFCAELALPRWARPVACGLLALNIDLAMDAVAIRLGFWDWGRGLSFEYYGVPYANFWAWFWVVMFFSLGLDVLAGSRLSLGRGRSLGRWLGPLGAIVIGLVGVLGTNAIIIDLVPRGLQTATIAVTLGVALCAVLAQRPKRPRGSLPKVVFAVPLAFHCYFLAAGLLAGFLLQKPVLLAVSVAMFGLSLWLHRPRR